MTRRWRRGLILLAAILLFPAAAYAEGEGASAADAAVILRDGMESAQYQVWERAQVHGSDDENRQVRFVAVTLLNYVTGQGNAPPAQAAIALTPCREVPLPNPDLIVSEHAQYNLHGLIVSEAPLTEISLSITTPNWTGRPYPLTAKVSIPPEANCTRYCLDETEIGGGKPLNELVDFRTLKTGKHTIVLTASSTAAKDVKLYESNFRVTEAENRFPLQQYNFSDNYYAALRFFGYDTEKFMPTYSIKGGGEEVMISTATEWRNANIVDTDTVFGRVHIDAVPYFEQAQRYLETGYFRVESEGRDTKVRCLLDLIEDCGSYVPRFQNNGRYISHHSLGVCSDINNTSYPNLDIQTNHDLVGNDVRDKLSYNGIRTDEETGQKYYSFTYTGNYPRGVCRVPKTIVNYLLYELALYRAGFGWGFYYFNHCDAMHFTLTDTSPDRHDSPDGGLRKVFEYYN